MNHEESETQCKKYYRLLIGGSVVGILLFLLPWFSNSISGFLDLFKLYGTNFTLLKVMKDYVLTDQFMKTVFVDSMPLVMLAYFLIVIGYLGTLYYIISFIIKLVKTPRKQETIQSGYFTFDLVMALPIAILIVLLVIRLTMGSGFEYLYSLTMPPFFLFILGAICRFWIVKEYENTVIQSATYEVKKVEKVVCKQCGKQYDSDGAICPYCGIKNDHMIYWECSCGAENSERQVRCGICHTYRV